MYKFALATMLIAGGNAFASNLVLDGNFALEKTGTETLNGTLVTTDSSLSAWSVTSSGTTSGVATIALPQLFVAPLDPLTTGGAPVAVGLSLWFYSDGGTNDLTQTVDGLIGGQSYEVSFDVMKTYLGQFNSGDPSF